MKTSNAKVVLKVESFMLCTICLIVCSGCENEERNNVTDRYFYDFSRNYWAVSVQRENLTAYFHDLLKSIRQSSILWHLRSRVVDIQWSCSQALFLENPIEVY